MVDMDERKLTCKDDERGGRCDGGQDRAAAPRASTLANEGGFRRTTSATARDAMGRRAAAATGVAMGTRELRGRGLRTLAK
jgi:hypothetical protein